jgi:hypothetical protein
MLVRSLCDHYNKQYRREGEEFEYSGPPYEHIEPVEQAEEKQPAKPVKSKGSKPVD